MGGGARDAHAGAVGGGAEQSYRADLLASPIGVEAEIKPRVEAGGTGATGSDGG
jgi:hypothetical protein